jgi:hypothetical protein
VSEPTWGNVRLPLNALRFKCVKDKGLVEINESYAGERTLVLTFHEGSQTTIAGSSPLYFEDQLVGSKPGSLEDSDVAS